MKKKEIDNNDDYIDIGVNSLTYDETNSNEIIINVLEQYLAHVINEGIMMKSAEDKNKNSFRKTAVQNGINLIKDLSIQITSGKHALELLKTKGLGVKMASKIDEILKTGTLEELTQTETEETRAITNLKEIKGIGDVNAQKLYFIYGIKSVEQLKKSQNKIDFNFTNEMKIGLEYYDDFKQPIPYDEIELLRPYIENTIEAIDTNLKYEICGSHRREKALSGDIDILFSHDKIETMNELKKAQRNYLADIVDELKKSSIITDIIALDRNSNGILFRGVCNIIGQYRQIDIHFVSDNIYYTALLHFTGSKQFNVKMRNIALQKGYTLTEHGLFTTENGKKGEMVPIKSEKDVFDILKVKYLSPKQRSL